MCLFLFFILVDCAALVMAMLCNDSHGPPGSGFVVIAMPWRAECDLLTLPVHMTSQQLITPHRSQAGTHRMCTLIQGALFR